MQTKAEKCLINQIKKILADQAGRGKLRLLNVGAGTSLVIEKSVADKKYDFVCDRVDVADCRADHPLVGRCFQAGVESMEPVESGAYDLAFANYVLEHVGELDRAAKEIFRVLKPGGYFVLSLPNPSAPEFRLSRRTPLWFHQMVKGEGEGKEAFETHYAYKDINYLIKLFENTGLKTVEKKYFPAVYGYLYKFPIINWLARAYDWLVKALGIKFLMGDVCLTFKKN